MNKNNLGSIKAVALIIIGIILVIGFGVGIRYFVEKNVKESQIGNDSEIFNQYCVNTEISPKELNIRDLDFDSIKKSIQESYEKEELDSLGLIIRQLDSLYKKPVMSLFGGNVKFLVDKFELERKDLDKKLRAAKEENLYDFGVSTYNGGFNHKGEYYIFEPRDNHCTNLVFNILDSVDPQNPVLVVAETYCVLINNLQTDTREKLIKLFEKDIEFNATLDKITLEELEMELKSNKFTKESEKSFALHQLGFKYMKSNDFDNSFKFYSCDAERYYNPFSMYRLTQVYANGTAGLKTMQPDIKVKKDIEMNNEKAYFWINSLFQVASVKPYESIFGSWDMLAALDDLQNRDYGIDKEKIGREMEIFLKKKYPQIFDFGDIRAHSIESVISALENYDSNSIDLNMNSSKDLFMKELERTASQLKEQLLFK